MAAIAAQGGRRGSSGVNVGEGVETGSLVGGEEGEHLRWWRGKEADATGKRGKREGGRRGGGRRAVAGEEYPVGQRYGDGRRRFCRRGEEGEKGEKNKEDKEKKEREEKISRKIETENGFRLNLKTESKYRLYLETEKKKIRLYF